MFENVLPSIRKTGSYSAKPAAPTGMGDLQSKLLTVAEAKKRKADTILQSRKQQKLLQAEQPKTIECIA